MIRYEVGTRTILLGLLCATGLGGSWAFDLIPSEDSSLRTSQAEALARQVALALPALPGRSRIAVARLAGDDAGRLEQSLREWLGRRNLVVTAPTWRERADRLFGDPLGGDDPASALSRLAKQRQADYLLTGRVLAWTTFPDDQAVLQAEFRIDDVRSGETVLEQSFVHPPPRRTSTAVELLAEQFSDEVEGGSPSVVGIAWRVTLWATAVFLAPWLAGGVITGLLARESNRVNAGLLAALVLAATGSAWLLWAADLSRQFGPLLTLLAGALATPYLGYACGLLNRFRDA